MVSLECVEFLRQPLGSGHLMLASELVSWVIHDCEEPAAVISSREETTGHPSQESIFRSGMSVGTFCFASKSNRFYFLFTRS